MSLRIFTVLLAVCATVAPWVSAESTDCTTPVVIIPDGRPTQSSFPQSTTYWYGIHAQAGHSYSVEFEPPAQNNVNGGGAQFNLIVVYGPNDYEVELGTSAIDVVLRGRLKLDRIRMSGLGMDAVPVGRAL